MNNGIPPLYPRILAEVVSAVRVGAGIPVGAAPGGDEVEAQAGLVEGRRRFVGDSSLLRLRPRRLHHGGGGGGGGNRRAARRWKRREGVGSERKERAKG